MPRGYGAAHTRVRNHSSCPSVHGSWGCGHSLGLIIMTALFYKFDIDLKRVGPYCEALVGVFMIALGASFVLCKFR